MQDGSGSVGLVQILCTVITSERFKRSIDLVLSGAGLLATVPVCAGVGAAIRVLDGSPVLFVQKRVGRDRSTFKVFKFRTMRDGRPTGIGRLLRATGLDELPQLVNVLVGDMSLIGPRPLTAADIERLGWDGPECDARWSVQPGLTGMAQLSHRCDPDLSLRLDTYYAENTSLWLEAIILLGTCASPLARAIRTWDEHNGSRA
jgi:lipopolysaccharide/colanic/teichoic acid biosynthesis glycosyltransferase